MDLDEDDYSTTLQVMVSTSGTQLLPKEAVKELREDIIPLTTVLTPNIPEAKLLLHNASGKTQYEPGNLDEMISLAKDVQLLGSKWVLLKGGHLPLSKDYVMVSNDKNTPAIVVDVLTDGKQVKLIESEYSDSKNTHGTGCSLACESLHHLISCAFLTRMLMIDLAAIACNVALGNDIPEACQRACRYVGKGIETAVDRGKGSGPINHFHSTQQELRDGAS